jgi:acetyl-CoA carboxylase carboxyl transferase subunit alpha
MYLVRTLRELIGKPIDQLLEARYQKFRRMGVFQEGQLAAGAAPAPHAPRVLAEAR